LRWRPAGGCGSEKLKPIVVAVNGPRKKEMLVGRSIDKNMAHQLQRRMALVKNRDVPSIESRKKTDETAPTTAAPKIQATMNPDSLSALSVTLAAVTTNKKTE
jgi:hypothetical protein